MTATEKGQGRAMIGVVVVSHCGLAEAFVTCGQTILGEIKALTAVSIDASDSHEVALGRIRGAIKALGDVEMVLLLTDMFGGTPSNVSLSLLEAGHVEVVSGVNMPMLLHAVTSRDRAESLDALAASTAAAGSKNMVIAGALLGGSETAQADS